MVSSPTPAFISPIASLADVPLDLTLKLGILASGSGSNFEAIAQNIAEEKLKAQIQVMIYNNPQAKARARAERWGIPAVLLNHRNYSQREDFDREIVKTLHQYQAEWVIMAGWMRVVTEVLLDEFRDRVLNIHPSLLPSFPGTHGVEEALKAGVKITGCTVHLARPQVDSGPILVQAAVPILPDDTPETLHARIQVQEHLIYPLGIALAARRNSSIGDDRQRIW